MVADRPLVDFLIIGVQKGGTTVLHDLLNRVPGVQMSCPKETHYFDDDSLDWDAPDPAPLHAAFGWAEPALRGEATPITLYWPQALARLHHYNPRAKLIILLRHPAWRAYSHWRMETARGWENLPFDAAIGPQGRARFAAAGVHRVFSYRERGLYADQIVSVRSLFAHDAVLFLRTDNLWSWPDETMATVCRFLGVDQPGKIGIESHVDAAHNDLIMAQIADLTTVYADDIARTATLTGLDLTDWLTPRYLERKVTLRF